jgi:hypothetical protein
MKFNWISKVGTKFELDIIEKKVDVTKIIDANLNITKTTSEWQYTVNGMMINGKTCETVKYNYSELNVVCGSLKGRVLIPDDIKNQIAAGSLTEMNQKIKADREYQADRDRIKKAMSY